jgi:hypothetical protein
LYDIVQDVDCRNDLAHDKVDVVKQIQQIFEEAHADSTWYVNPGETKEQVAAKRKQAEAMNSMQQPTRANTAYRGKAEAGPSDGG